MASNRAEAVPATIERRTAIRSRVSCSATFRTPGGERHGLMWDLSTTGARLQFVNPPRVGVTALLEWEGQESLCKVVWATDDACGVEFDRPISRAFVDHCAGRLERLDETVAAVNNIPLGARRSRRDAFRAKATADLGEFTYSWRIGLSRPAGGTGELGPDRMSPAELMFFHGSPLSHVATYDRYDPEA